jgi:cytosine/adenosine deaminase-related metal-dependent hydrolase
MVGRAHKRGIGVALGVDVPALVNSAIMTQMRLLYLLQRYMEGAHERGEGQTPIARRPGWPQLDTKDVLRFGTLDGVEALGFGGDVGKIEVGYQADLVLLDARTFGISESGLASHVVMNATPGDVDSVMVAGEFRKRDGVLVGVDGEDLQANRVAARDRVLATAGEIGAGGLIEDHWDWVARD